MSTYLYYNLFAFVLMFVTLLTNAETKEVTNSGREFILAFTEHFRSGTTLELYLTAAQGPLAGVNVSAPLRQDVNTYTDMTLLGTDVLRVTVNPDLTLHGTRVQDNGIWIRSDVEMTVQCYSFYDNSYTPSAGGFMAYPVESLGREYVVVTYCIPDYLCQFAVVATVDNTTVSINFKLDLNHEVIFNSIAYVNGDSQQLILNRFQTFQVQSTGDLTGTKIESSQAVTVIAGSPYTTVQNTVTFVTYTNDHLAEQLPPVRSWGSTFVVTPFPNVLLRNYIRIVVNESTQVRVDGVISNVSSLDRYKDVSLNVDRPTIVISDRPVLLAHFSQSPESGIGSYSDASVAIVTPVGRWRREFVFSSLSLITSSLVSPNQHIYISIVTTIDCSDGVILDGLPITNGWVRYYEYAHTSVESLEIYHQLSVLNQSCTLSGDILGIGLEQAWSMPLGWYFKNIWNPESTSVIQLYTDTTTFSPTTVTMTSAVESPFKTPISSTSFSETQSADTSTETSYSTFDSNSLGVLSSPFATVFSDVMSTMSTIENTVAISTTTGIPTETLYSSVESYGQSIQSTTVVTLMSSDVMSERSSIVTTVENTVATSTTTDKLLSFSQTQQSVIDSNSQGFLSSTVGTVVVSDVISVLGSTSTTTEMYVQSEVTTFLEPSLNYLSTSDTLSNTDIKLQSTTINMASTTESGLIKVSETVWATDTLSMTSPSTTGLSTIPSTPATADLAKNSLVCSFCVCRNTTYTITAETLQALQEYLAVDTRSLSATIRKYISIQDHRPSAVVIGFSGILFLCIAGLLLCVNDLITMWSYFRSKCREVHSRE